MTVLFSAALSSYRDPRLRSSMFDNVAVAFKHSGAQSVNGPRGRLQIMLRLARRMIMALGLTGLIATLFRLRGTGGVPPQTGGWKEVTGSDLNR